MRDAQVRELLDEGVEKCVDLRGGAVGQEQRGEVEGTGGIEGIRSTAGIGVFGCAGLIEVDTFPEEIKRYVGTGREGDKTASCGRVRVGLNSHSPEYGVCTSTL